jgi:hypothetical protein
MNNIQDGKIPCSGKGFMFAAESPVRKEEKDV